MQTEVMFAGFGGQGILASGKILARAAMAEGFEVAWVPSYGPEMRGGTAYCLVVISDRPIGSPIVKRPQHLVAMNRPSLEKFAPMLMPNGTILINTTLIPVDAGRDDLRQVKVPATTLAAALGNSKAANVVALGAFIARTGIIAFGTLIASVKAEFAQKDKLVDLNLRALEAGRASALERSRGEPI
jgi:2-oxoglutarate ferredoxin oxidoreductase subunit gamma